jgi:hypothetical protein
MVRLQDYDFDSEIGTVNRYMYQKMENGMSFLAYREEEKDLTF